MANAARGEVGVDVGGQRYTLRPTFDALCELEGLVDKPIDAVLAAVSEGRVSGVRSVIWCLLQDKHSGEIRTLKQASEWIEAVGGAEVAIAIVQQVFAINAEAPVGETGAAAANPPAGTGAPLRLALAESA